MAKPSETGGTARPHGDTVHGQLAMLSDEHWRQILDADARTTGHNDDVRVSVQGVQNGLPVVADQAMAGTVSLGGGAHGVALNVDATELVTALNATVADVTEPSAPKVVWQLPWPTPMPVTTGKPIFAIHSRADGI